ncbi:MAG: ATP-binding protein, partial [Candidatus Auribacterota bacterium]|nr:ATP-binding protein [Candidatus Auribacterota bacterium]
MIGANEKQDLNRMEKPVEISPDREFSLAGVEWRWMLDAIPDLIAIMDRQYHINWINKAMADKLGVAPEKVRGLKCHQVLHGTDEPISSCPHARLISTGEEESEEIFIERLGGNYLVTVSPIQDSQGRLIGSIHLARDISDRKQMEEEAIRGQKIEAIGRMAGGIAHDFNNILAGIVGYTTLLKEGCQSNSSVSADLESIERLVMRGAELSRALLIYSRKGKYTRAILNLNDLVDEVSGVIRRTVSKDIEMNVRLAPDLPEIIGDRGHLYQAVTNLSLNAAEAMPDGGVLTITTSVQSPTGTGYKSRLSTDISSYVAVTVSDSGAGMDNETRKFIFEPFFTTKVRRPGKGLGLSMVAGIAGRHGGSIEVESEPGRGSIFTLFLPLGEETPAVTSVPPPAETGPGAILIVDDEEDFRSTLSRWLEGHGFRVLSAAGGEEALKYLKEKKEEISLVLLDMVMEGMGGAETFRALRDIVPDLSVIICSGGPLDDVCKEMLDE